MALPPDLLGSTCSIYRPFGAGSPTQTGVACRLAADFLRGRTGTVPEWTHFIDLDAAADVLDGCTRTADTAAIDYADGDEVRLTVGGSPQRFAVVWVEQVAAGTSREHKRAYLLRHST